MQHSDCTIRQCRLLDEDGVESDGDGWVGGSLNIGNWFADRQAHGSASPTVEIELRHDKRLHSARPASTEVPPPYRERVRVATFLLRESVNHEQFAGNPLNFAIRRPYANRQTYHPAREEESRAC